MKKAKGIIILLVALAFVFVLSGCNDNSTVQAETSPNSSTTQTASNTESTSTVDALTLEQIEGNPRSFLGDVMLAGVVGSVDAREFFLFTEDGTFEISVDYRGSQALPQVGDEVIITGQLIENRPCCGGGFTIITTRFDIAE